MPRCAAVYRHVSHRVIYSPFTLEMPWHAMGSKNSADTRAGGDYRLVCHLNSIALIAKCGELLQRGFPALVFVGVDLAVLELCALLCPQLDRHRGFGRVRSLGALQREDVHDGVDHPRVCGEHGNDSKIVALRMGSSPRVRGTPTAVALYSAESGIIPACAGNTRSFSSNLFMLLDHPRVCGEHAEWDSSRAYEPGSSPRVRGTPLKMRPSALVQGIIPACAGNTGMSRPDRLLPEDHPRVCGEHARLLLRCAYIWGSSPRVRGTLSRAPDSYLCIGIIPACAGNTGSATLGASAPRDHPRVCGEHTTSAMMLTGVLGSSPRVRGTQCT